MRISILPVILLFALFLGSAYVAQEHQTYLASLIGHGPEGLFLYALLAMVTTVVAPLTSIPLIPLAASVWGPFMTAVASILGWLGGALVAFFLSRRYGRPLVEKFIAPEQLIALERRVPRENLFWSIVLLRMTVPVDVLSYALGLFTSVPWRTYFFATLIGIIPFAFILAYAGMLPLEYQMLLAILGLALVFGMGKRKAAGASL